MIVERQDIDALLISALYGELTPSQESELTAHLASHPGDKLALEGLTATRDAVRASRILAVQLEPPQSISAMLIQEAARRAPKSPAEGEGWFGRFVRTFVQHPAMAAAAMLVLIVGIAGVVGRNKGNQFANEASDQSLSAPSSSAKRGDMLEGGAAGSSANVAQNEAPAAAPTGTASGSGPAFGYADTGAARDENRKVPDTADNDSRAVDKIGMGVTLAEEHQQGTKTATADGIVLDRRAAGPKDFAGDDKKGAEKESLRNRDGLQQKAKQSVEKNNADLDGADYISDEASRTDDETVATLSNKAPGASGGAAPPAPPPPPPPVQPSRQYATPPAATRSQAPTTTTGSQIAPTSPRVVAPVTPSPAPASVTAPKPAPKQEAPKQAAPAKAESKSFDEKPAEAPKTITKSEPKADAARSDPNTDWAKAQHAMLIAKARDGQCSGAADLAVAIENRAPGYYSQFVANDRDLKTCMSYITAAREKEAEKRASLERAKKAGAEPTAAKKADTKPAATESSK